MKKIEKQYIGLTILLLGISLFLLGHILTFLFPVSMSLSIVICYGVIVAIIGAFIIGWYA